MIDLRQGDCLEVMPALEGGSVDMVLCDLPYGTTGCEWDSVIPLAPLWEQYRRLLAPAGAVVLTASQPFTADLVGSNRTWFKYALVWQKSKVTGFLDCRFRPLKSHEDVLVFSPAGCSNGSRPPMTYRPQMGAGPPYKRNRKLLVTRSVARTDVLRTDTVSDGRRYPQSILRYPNETGLHPTQKPTALMEYLVRTYTDPGALVLDNAMGSGTTGVACVRSGRRFVGIEKDPGYFAAARRRIEAARGEAA